MQAVSRTSAPGAGEPRVCVLKMQFHMMTNYNYLIVDPSTRQAVIVDPAWQMDKIDEALELAQADLRGILVTHSHPDHLNLAAPLAARLRCPIWMSKREIADSGFDSEWLVGLDGAPWYVGGMQIQPILTPGHTPGCVCFLVGDNLFTGDVLFAEGCGMCPDLEGAYAMYQSLEYLKTLISPQTLVYPGHSYGKAPGQPFSQLLRDNIYLQFNNPQSFAAFRLRRRQNRSNVFGQ